MTTVGSGNYTYELTESWAKLPAGETFGMVSAVATDSENKVYAFQRAEPPVVIFNTDGSFAGSWGLNAITNPHGIFIENDIVYITDREDSVCLRYTLDGKPLQVIGDRGVHSDTGCEVPGTLVPPGRHLPDCDRQPGYGNQEVKAPHRRGGPGFPGPVGPGGSHVPRNGDALYRPAGSGGNSRHQGVSVPAGKITGETVAEILSWTGIYGIGVFE